ncbi:MAG: hypothetical protein WDN26_11765 [Chitinophagaceae bacterium]
MENLISTSAKRFITGFTSLVILASLSSCDKDEEEETPASKQSFTVVNTVATDATFTGARVDAHLINGWGIAFSATGTAWISSPGDHTTVIYNGATSAQQLAPVAIPGHGTPSGGLPSGQVFNSLFAKIPTLFDGLASIFLRCLYYFASAFEADFQNRCLCFYATFLPSAAVAWFFLQQILFLFSFSILRL